MFKHSVNQFSFAQNEYNTHDADEYFEKHYEKLNYSLKNGEEPSMDDMSMDITEYPFTVNISNPNKSYYAPPCRNCESKSCKNCPLPIT